MEGAGSISEINLRNTDLVNLPMARHAKADVILVGDIDRGGVFASVYGSIALQTPEDRALIKGIIINKFRGDMRLFEEGRKMMEDICGIPVLGVIPYMKDIHIEEEDSVALAMKSSKFIVHSSKVNVAVIMLQHISNYTDFDVLEQDARLNLFYTNNVEDIRQSDIIILPGTKSTLSDLYELRRNGCAQAIIQAHHDGATVLGICGGYQMLGREVSDPLHVEGDIERLPGLGLLPITTTMEGEKVTRQTEFHYQGQLMKGYEIHMGQTTPLPPDGGLVWEQNHCLGTYVHGILDNQAFVEHLLAPFHDKLQEAAKPFDYQAYKEEQYNRLADHVRQHVDMNISPGRVMAFNACVMRLQVIGEHVGRLMKEDSKPLDKYTEIPWHAIYGMRNIISHEYANIDETVIISAIKEDLPKLKDVVEELLRQYSKSNSLNERHNICHFSYVTTMSLQENV